MTPRTQFDQIRRRLEERIDQAWALSCWKIGNRQPVEQFDGDPRFALVVVNFSTTRFLKLMLLTLAEQRPLDLLKKIVIVDNHSLDGGVRFLRALASRVDRIALVENRAFLSHARGMRRGLALLDTLETNLDEKQRINIVVSCDTDVVFRRDDTLTDLAELFVRQGAALAGELRVGNYPYPEAQASFIAVRRDCYARQDIAPWVNHGAPAYWMQRSIWQAGLAVLDFPSNRAGYILHRGRSGVAAARTFLPSSSYSSIENNEAHYMGVQDGAKIWNEIETRWAHLLRPEAEESLITHLVEQYSRSKSSCPSLLAS